MLRMKKLSEIYGMKVYTDEGDYFGDIEEVIVSQTKVNSWRVRAIRGSLLSKVLGSAKGVIVPHGLVKSIGDVMVISRSAAPARSDDE
jgi:sporulation protein YlmC with PRC-barrel domain